QVSLQRMDSEWFGNCSSPIGFDCKHVVAAMLELQTRAGASATREGVRAIKERKVVQPPRSPLYDKLVEHHGRPLTVEEGAFVRKVQDCYANAQFRKVTQTELGSMAGRHQHFYDWEALDLWRDRPGDDYYYWLYVAWELRRRQWQIPA